MTADTRRPTASQEEIPEPQLPTPASPRRTLNRQFLDIALPHLHSISHPLSDIKHAVRLLDDKGEVLHARGPALVPHAIRSRAEVHGASGKLMGVIELELPPGSTQPLATALTDHLARSIERELATGMVMDLAQSRQNDPNAALRLAAIVESSEDAIIGKDLDGIVTNWNTGAERMYGYCPQEIVGRHISMLTVPGDEEEIEQIMRRLRRGERILNYETRRMRKNGEILQVALTISPIRNAAGEIIGASTIARDITKIKRAEHTLRMTEKLAATGRLAASIAHEINNPMASVTNLMYLLQHHPTLDEGARQYVQLAQEELDRITHIVRQMLGFYREAESPVPVSLKEVLDNVLVLYARKLRNAHIEVERRYSYDSPVQAFPGEVRQVFSNLLVNAIEAVGQRGKIVVRVQAGHDWSHPERHGVRVTVADNGPGIDREDRRRVFEPFFTTKGERGTGLGLWVSEGIVRKHGGSIRVRSTDRGARRGTSFSVFLPQQADLRPRERLRRRRAEPSERKVA
jgi:two-component system, chemotaxis family, CheB/CheR fusion protein